jgi:hypothetical protein
MYLKALELSLQGDETWQHNYEWLMIQLYDQAVREQSGGEFLKYLQRSAIPSEDFVCSRSGEARRVMQKFRGRPLDGSRSATRTRSSWPLFRGWPGLLRSAILRVILGEKD